MRKFTFSFKSLLVAFLLLGGANSAWADTTIGATNKGWSDSGACTSSMPLAANKTLTLNFTVTQSAGQNHQGPIIILAKGNANTWGANQYLFLRSDYAYRIGEFDWGVGALSNINSNPAVATKDFFVGASVQTVIERMGPVVTITTSVTKETTTHTNTYKQIIDTTDDIYVFLAADKAVLTLPSPYSSITDTDTSSHPSTITFGQSDNNGPFYGTYVNTLGQNESMNMHFTNYSGTTDTYKTWGIELVYPNGGSKYLDIIAGNKHVWGDLTADAKTAQLTTSANWPASILTSMDEADVTLTVTRQGRFVYITAVHTPKSGDPFTLTYTLEPKDAFSDFATTNLGVRIITDHSHVDYNYAVGKINASMSSYGYATFSSVYPVNFDGTGLTPFIVTGTEDSKITMQSVTGDIAANTGLVLKGSEGYYTVPTVSSGTIYNSESNPKNYMFPESKTTNINAAGAGSGTNYVLTVQTEKVVFAPIGTTSASVRAGQAALWLPSGIALVKVLNIVDDTATGVEAPVAAEAVEDGIYYNLNGQQVTKDYKGIVIVNGKKFYNK